MVSFSKRMRVVAAVLTLQALSWGKPIKVILALWDSTYRNKQAIWTTDSPSAEGSSTTRKTERHQTVSHVHGLHMAGLCRDVHDLKSSCPSRLPSLQNIGKQQTLEYHFHCRSLWYSKFWICNSFIVSFTQPRSDHRNKSCHFLLGKIWGIFALRFPTWHDHVVWNQPQGVAPRARKNPLPFVPRIDAWSLERAVGVPSVLPQRFVVFLGVEFFSVVFSSSPMVFKFCETIPKNSFKKNGFLEGSLF